MRTKAPINHQRTDIFIFRAVSVVILSSPVLNLPSAIPSRWIRGLSDRGRIEEYRVCLFVRHEIMHRVPPTPKLQS